MYAITGITGKVGGALARKLLADHEPVRAVVRDARRGEAWAALGCEVAIADNTDAAALTQAFTGARGVFILPAPVFDPEPGYPEARTEAESIVAALKAARPEKIVCLSTIGADATHDNLLSQRTLIEHALAELSIPVTILRPAWFIDNAAWDVEPARTSGVIASFLQPIDASFPMVAAKDVGETAAELLRQDWQGTRIVELEGPRRISPNDLAQAFASVLHKPVHAVPVPRDTWRELFLQQGMQNPEPRMRMLDGFNEGWIAFPDDGKGAIKGKTDAVDVIAGLVASAGT